MCCESAATCAAIRSTHGSPTADCECATHSEFAAYGAGTTADAGQRDTAHAIGFFTNPIGFLNSASQWLGTIGFAQRATSSAADHSHTGTYASAHAARS